jgi:hypothetical protein
MRNIDLFLIVLFIQRTCFGCNLKFKNGGFFDCFWKSKFASEMKADEMRRTGVRI